MKFEKVIKILESNTNCNLAELKILLLRIAKNILKDPESNTYTFLGKKTKVMSEKILSIKGGKEVILLMGFMEHDLHFTFPKLTSNNKMPGDILILQYLRNIHNKLLEWNPVAKLDDDQQVSEELSDFITGLSLLGQDIIQRPTIPEQLCQYYCNPFLRKICKHFHQAQIYANKSLKENAKEKIPLFELQLEAQKRMRNLQKLAKEGKIEETSISVDELLLIALLRWFKEEFFTWMNSPECTTCGGTTTFSHYSSDINLMKYADRVEIFICDKCWQMAAFPRYNDLNILLETRTGRCGEWANVFTLMCHAIGWDARIVIDETDHVWTEVYSQIQKRWIHCDPCENVSDTPLMYENGWGKKLSYVMAYSPYELQDVTWRYSSQHQSVLERRVECEEKELVSAIIKLRNDRLRRCTPTKRMYILKRCVEELVELLQERQPKDLEMQGRSSGSLDWRLARGETTETAQSSFIFRITNTQHNKTCIIKYCCALDKYVIDRGDEYHVFSNWHEGVYSQSNMMRKEEHDWKQVYLCRTEGSDTGFIAWNFKLVESRISNIKLKMVRKVFENGVVNIKITGDNGKHLFLSEEGYLETNYFKESSSLLIEATLSGGKGSEAWQHAQLFRESMDAREFFFELTIGFL